MRNKMAVFDEIFGVLGGYFHLMLNWPGQNQTLSRHEGFRRAIPGTSAENVTMVIMACTCPVFLHMLLGVGHLPRNPQLGWRTTILWNAGKEASVLLVLGFVRLIINSLFNKTSNVFEYGKHWNFFFTIAVVKFSSTSLLQFTPIFLHKYLGFIVLFLHQAALSTTAVRSFASKGWFGDRSRKGFIDANREGLISTIGFIGLYFIGVNFGRFLMKNRETVGDWLKCLCTLLFVCCLSWMSLQVSNVLLGKPSRRLANLPYALCMICIITSGIVQHIIYDIVVACCRPVVQRDKYGDSDPDSKDDIRCLLLEAMNYNGLLFFLVANLLTGLVNLAIDTKLYSSSGAFFVLTVYMFMLSATSLILYKNKISFKAIIFQKLLRLY